MSTRSKSTIQEKMLEKFLSRFRAYRTPNSGAGSKKGDLQDELSIYEAKTSMTEQKQYTIKKEDLETLEADRRISRKQLKFLIFDFGKSEPNETYVVMSLRDFNKLYDTYFTQYEEDMEYLRSENE